MKIQTLLTATASLAALAFAVPADAQHDVVYDARTEAQASSHTHQGPNVIGSNGHFLNGAVIPQNSWQGNAGSYNGGGSSSETWATTEQFGGAGGNALYNTSYASANLATGELKASTISTGPNNFGSPLGNGYARFDDTIFFTNTSGSALTIGMTYAFNGTMSDPFAGNPGGNLSLGLACFSGDCYNELGDRIAFATGPLRTPQDNWNYYWNMTSSCFGENIYCGQGAAPYFQSGLNQPNAGGVVDGWISTALVIPTGTSSIGLRATLNVDCRGGSSCDFGHTSTFRFDDLPTGLSFSSASGQLLSAVGVPPTTGAVPEPATWLMMILGFGLVGAAMRRPRREVRVRYA